MVKVKSFIREHLFAPSPVDLENPVVLRNLSETEVGKILYDSFKTSMNSLTIQESGTSRIEDWIRLKETRPFRVENRSFRVSKKSIFSKIVGEAKYDGFELFFASFLDAACDVQSFTKNYLAIGFKLDYVRADGDLSNYVPDFFVRSTDGTVYIIETKGREELDIPQKMARLKQWCADATTASVKEDGVVYRFLYIDQKGFEKHQPNNLSALASSFTEYQ